MLLNSEQLIHCTSEGATGVRAACLDPPTQFCACLSDVATQALVSAASWRLGSLVIHPTSNPQVPAYGC